MRSQAAGLLVLLDMHTLSNPEANQGLWCGWGTACTAETEAPLFLAWRTLAARYCDSHPNVIGADLVSDRPRARTRARPHRHAAAHAAIPQAHVRHARS